LAARGHELHVLCAEYDPARPHGTLVWRFSDDLPVTELVNNWCFPSFAESYRGELLDRQLDHVLRAVQPDVLHIHNLLNLSLDLPRLAGARGIPSVATLHEYTLVCPSGGQRVHLGERTVCHDIDPVRCATCFPRSHLYAQMVYGRVSRVAGRAGAVTRLIGAVRRRFPRLFARAGRIAAAQVAARERITAGDISARLDVVRGVFEDVDLFVAPSPALAADFRRFGLPADRLRVSDYGFLPIGPVPRTARDGRLRFGFVGTLVWHKGAHVLVEAVRRLPADAVSVHLFGSLDTFPDYVAGLREAARDLPVRFEGGFDREHLAEVYGRIDVLVVCSLWPENSPLVIHEAFMAGLPVVGSRLGGTADLVRDGVNGLLYEADSPDSLAAALRRLLDDPKLPGRLAAAHPPVKTMAEDAAEWEAVYREVVRARSAPPARVP
jgi:glycosyltransferase involved in cell wall biosynthesis